ncbi:hypothetical protein AB4238_14670 [Shewanella sp. 10N.286.45.A1]|uniref:hypothetical protein n=1 Tax=Shewanella sp. 10N.286.45.A1 TaxID=3229694 RepID=UPI00355423FE
MLANKRAQFDDGSLERLFPILTSLKTLIKVVVITLVWLAILGGLLVISRFPNLAFASDDGTVTAITPSSVNELQQAEKLKITTRLAPVKAVSPQQQVDLYIQISTDTWFAGGSHISAFDVEDTVVLRRKKLANNYTERVDGKTWSVQEWQLTLYPQAIGVITVPKIAVTVNVADKPGSSVKGTLYTQPQHFTVLLPDERLANTNHYIAAPKVTFEQKMTPENGSELHIGDAITRTLTIKATDSSAMLFPDFPLAESEMLYGYRGPVESRDNHHRGDFSANKVYQQIYVVQQSGTVNLPELSLYWWNTKDEELTVLTAKALSWQVTHTPLSFVKAFWLYGLLLLVVLALTVKGGIWTIKRIQKQQCPVAILFVYSLITKQYARAEQYLYWRNSDKNKSVIYTHSLRLLGDSAQGLKKDVRGLQSQERAKDMLLNRWQQGFAQKNDKDRRTAKTRRFYLMFWRSIPNRSGR